MTDDNKYKNGKIYTIRYKNDDSLIYVGSTVQPLYKRFNAHKSDSKNPKNENRQLYQKFNETDINDWYIELYEDYACNRKEELNRREGQEIREVGTLNQRIEDRTPQEHREYIKEYYENKKIKILANMKEYYDNNKDKKKEYYDNNKEKISEYYKEYNINKDKKITCDCGCIVNKFTLARHKRSQKHQEIIKTISI